MGTWHPVDFLLPRRCVLCRASCKSNLCTACQADLPTVRDPCHRCGLRLDLLRSSNQARSNPGNLCGPCIRRPPPFDQTIAALDYVFPVNVLVQRFKFKRSLACGAVLSDRLAETLRAVQSETDAPPECLVPVPLHPLRQFRRVYNQAELIACDLGKALSIPVRPRALRRTRKTRSQPGLTARQRRRNLQGAISARKFTEKRIALVDDVMTTGATVSECARVLKKAGAKHVSVWVAARAPCA